MENLKDLEKDIKELHKVVSRKVQWKVDGVVTEEFKKYAKEQYEAKIKFQEKWGEQRLTTFVLYSTLKSRLANVPKCLNKSVKLKNNKQEKF